jgi:hypothetical protein
MPDIAFIAPPLRPGVPIGALQGAQRRRFGLIKSAKWRKSASEPGPIQRIQANGGGSNDSDQLSCRLNERTKN